ncbi:MAG: nitroreductase family protein [Proteobacteria bacterium]|nr:nitroreductase family protein [Pseudomonadota bacterium]
MKIRRIKNRCNLCMLCVRECVSGAWRVVDGQPSMVAPNLCNRCSHCVAVCPQAAIYHQALDYFQVKETDPDQMKPSVYHDIIRSRRSIRQFKHKAVPQDAIQDLLDLASHSPTASNRQHVAYTVISQKKILDDISNSVFGFSKGLYMKTRKGLGKQVYRILKTLFPDSISRYLDPMDYYIRESEKGRDYILHGAPVLILVHGPKGASFVNENCNIAATNIMNYAQSMSLGTCYIGFLTLALKFSGALRKKARVPKGQRVYAALVLGYPAYKHGFTASRKRPVISWVHGHE